MRSLKRFVESRTDLDQVVPILRQEANRLQTHFNKSKELYKLMAGPKTKHVTAVLLHKIGDFRRKNRNSDIYWQGLPVYE